MSRGLRGLDGRVTSVALRGASLIVTDSPEMGEAKISGFGEDVAFPPNCLNA